MAKKKSRPFWRKRKKIGKKTYHLWNAYPTKAKAQKWARKMRQHQHTKVLARVVKNKSGMRNPFTSPHRKPQKYAIYFNERQRR